MKKTPLLMALLMALAVTGMPFAGCGNDSTNTPADGDVDTDSDLELLDFADNNDDADTKEDGDVEQEAEKVLCDDDGLACTDETVESGVCRHNLQNDWCLINQVCYFTGAANPNAACSVCNPGENPTGWTDAADDTACDDDDPCTENDVCTSGQCDGSVKDCGDDVNCTIDACDPVNGQCINSPDSTRCGNDQYCDPQDDCTDGLCQPDARVCTDDTHYQTCNADGSAYIEADPIACLDPAPWCHNGVCVQCTAGMKKCEGAVPYVCDANQWSPGEACTIGCIDGSCADCTPGESRCDGNIPQTCDNAGQWQNGDACVGAEPVCAVVNDSAQCGACDPADTDPVCRNDDVQVCNESGAWEVSETCENDTPICWNGQCVACTPGQHTCDGDDAMLCDAGGSWVLVETCIGPDPACVDGACTSCTDGDTYCNGNTIMICSGGAWTVDGECAGETPVCNDGECVTCVPGQRGCEGNQPAQCNDQGVWEVEAACIGDTPYCLGGNCVPCIPDLHRCDGQELQICRPSDTGAPYWETTETCAANYRCDPANGCLELPNNHGLLLDGGPNQDYTNSHAVIPDADEFDPTGPLTIEAWIYPTAMRDSSNCHTNGHMIVEKWATAPGGQGNFMLAFCAKRFGSDDTNDPSIGDIRFGIIWDTETPNTNWVWFDDVVYLNNWSHIAAVWDEGEMRLYFNGVLMHRVANPWDTFHHTLMDYDIQIGQLDSWRAWAFFGIIDEVRISRGARYAGQNVSPEAYFTDDAMTVGLWHLDEGSGTTSADATSYGNNATFGSDAQWSTAGVGETP